MDGRDQPESDLRSDRLRVQVEPFRDLPDRKE
jgi:hypothetical protein